MGQGIPVVVGQMPGNACFVHICQWLSMSSPDSDISWYHWPAIENREGKYHKEVLVEFNPTGYMNDILFERYITSHPLPVLAGQPTLFALDLMGSYKSPVVLDLLQ